MRYIILLVLLLLVKCAQSQTWRLDHDSTSIEYVNIHNRHTLASVDFNGSHWIMTINTNGLLVDAPTAFEIFVKGVDLPYIVDNVHSRKRYVSTLKCVLHPELINKIKTHAKFYVVIRKRTFTCKTFNTGDFPRLFNLAYLNTH